MAFWRLTDVQRAALLKFVAGETVYELGCGDLKLARLMATTAKHVHAVDKELPGRMRLPANVTFYCERFEDIQFEWPVHLDTVVICWPTTQRIPGLVDLVKRAFRVVYIGCNTDGSACGDHELWLHLTKRMLVSEIRDKRNCLHWYSLAVHSDPKFRSEEEICGLINEAGRFRVMPYDRLLVGELREAQVVNEKAAES